MKKLISTLLLIMPLLQASAEEVKTDQKYVFYLHGRIIEQGNPKPEHPEFGLYDYPAIVSKFSEHGFSVIAEQRKGGTKHLAYAKKLASQINNLIDAGVNPEDITVVGFSKGGNITAITSSMLNNDQVNFVLMAICGAWHEEQDMFKNIKLKGHILSIYEETDVAGSCESLASRTPKPASFKEVAINTGKDHGAFYLPRDEWFQPLVSWINRE